MGTYLSTPVTEKCQESGEDLECQPFPISWGVVDMQGWRKTMEDSHIARTNVRLQEDDNHSVRAETAKVFGVFDGHGGAEVARFVQLYLVSVLTQQSRWNDAVLVNHAKKPSDARDAQVTLLPKESDVGAALVDTFHALDRMIDHQSRR